MPDKIEEAISVAVDVAKRRSEGEQINDDAIIREHQDLSPHIEQELKKLRLLGNARANAKPPPAGPNDIRLTIQVTDEDQKELDEYLPRQPFADPSAAVDGGDKQPTKATKPFRPSGRPAAAMLRVYHDDQREFENIALRGDRTVIGRVSGDIVIGHDPQISTEHAEIFRVSVDDRWEWHLRDLSSTNGTFISVNRAKLNDGDELLLGSQRFRFSLLGVEARLEHIVGVDVADSIELAREGTLVGREKGDQMEAFQDCYLDPKHAFIGVDRNNGWYVKNTRSVNGVWFRIHDQKLFRMCYLQMGEQRFGFRG